MLLNKKTSHQNNLEDYHNCIKEVQAWCDGMNSSLNALNIEGGKGRSICERLHALNDIKSTFDEGKELLKSLVQKSEPVIQDIGQMDKEQVQEKISSFNRWIRELDKQISRKSDVIKETEVAFKETRSEIEKLDMYLREKTAILGAFTDKDDQEMKLNEIQSLGKEVSSKGVVIESLDRKIGVIKANLEDGELKEILQCLKMLRHNHKLLENLVQDVHSKESEIAERRKILDEKIDAANTWLEAKTAEFFPNPDFNPLKAFAIEKKLVKLKRADADVRGYEELEVAKISRELLNIKKSSLEDKSMYVADVDTLSEAIQRLKIRLKARVSELEEEHKKRKQFEADYESCNQWLSRAIHISQQEMRGSINIATLDDQLQKFKVLKKEEEDTRTRICSLVDEANEMVKTVSDADRLTLQSQMDKICDKMNQTTEVTQKRVDSLIQNIEQYRKTAAKIEESVAHLTVIQSEIKMLNKPIGCRVEDAEDVLKSYEKILKDLREFKEQLEVLHRTAGANVNELKALLQQQTDLISAIEGQMQKIKALINLRYNFMELVAGITEFVVNFNEVVKKIEHADVSSHEKVKQYDDVLLKIGSCESKLTMAMDKGQQIADEGSSQDRNQITEQLQSLKAQILELKRTIEAKRITHFEQAQRNQKLLGEIEEHIDWLHDKESEVKSRPLLSTKIEGVEKEISVHASLSSSVLEYLEKVREIRDNALQEGSLSGRVQNALSAAKSLLNTLPNELSARQKYLEDNKMYRCQYDTLVEELNKWVEDAQLKLRSVDNGANLSTVEKDLADHISFFGGESRLHELLDKINENAHHIWASLNQQDQEKVSHEQDFFNQLVKNTLHSANSTKTALEDTTKLWKTYQELLTQISRILGDIVLDHEKPSNVNSVKTTISKIDASSKLLNKTKNGMTKFNDCTKALLGKVDSASKAAVSEKHEALNTSLRDMLKALKEKKETLAGLALQWEDLEAKSKAFDSSISGVLNKLSGVDSSFRSVSQMKEMKKELKVEFGLLYRFVPSDGVSILQLLNSHKANIYACALCPVPNQ